MIQGGRVVAEGQLLPDIQKQLGILRKGIGADEDTMLLPFSSETKQGREELYDLIDSWLGEEQAI